jgi:hypothetical protein
MDPKIIDDTISHLSGVKELLTQLGPLNDAHAKATAQAEEAKSSLGANQRASYRWVVAPGGPGEIVVPATNLAGYGIRTKSSTYVGTATAACKWRE